MTGFLQKVTLQMIRNCREAILGPGKLWDQDPSVLLVNLADAIRLSEAYQEQYRCFPLVFGSTVPGDAHDYTILVQCSCSTGLSHSMHR